MKIHSIIDIIYQFSQSHPFRTSVTIEMSPIHSTAIGFKFFPTLITIKSSSKYFIFIAWIFNYLWHCWCFYFLFFPWSELNEILLRIEFISGLQKHKSVNVNIADANEVSIYVYRSHFDFDIYKIFERQFTKDKITSYNHEIGKN